MLRLHSKPDFQIDEKSNTNFLRSVYSERRFAHTIIKSKKAQFTEQCVRSDFPTRRNPYKAVCVVILGCNALLRFYILFSARACACGGKGLSQRTLSRSKNNTDVRWLAFAALLRVCRFLAEYNVCSYACCARELIMKLREILCRKMLPCAAALSANLVLKHTHAHLLVTRSYSA